MDLCIKEIIKNSKQTLSLGWLKAPPKDPDWSQTYTQREVQKLTLVNSYPELISCLATKDNFIGAGRNPKRTAYKHSHSQPATPALVTLTEQPIILPCKL